jgi:hypothetical protein
MPDGVRQPRQFSLTKAELQEVIKGLKIDYCYSNPASSFRALHESMINYGNNKAPEFITCMHEESSVAMCHGYYKATGKPQMTLVHGTVGLQHAAMAVYNAGPTVCPSSWSAATISTPRIDRQACRPCTRRRISTCWCAISPSGTTSQCRSSISRSHLFAPTSSR